MNFFRKLLLSASLLLIPAFAFSQNANINGTPVTVPERPFLGAIIYGATAGQCIVAGSDLKLVGGNCGGSVLSTNFTGATVAARVQNAINSLPLSGTQHVGTVTIPANETSYDVVLNPMLTTGQQGVTCIDLRSNPQTGQPSGGYFVYDCSDIIAQNYFYYSTHGRFVSGNNLVPTVFPATAGQAAGTFWTMVSGGVMPVNGGVSDGSVNLVWLKQGLDTVTNSNYTSGNESECIIQGTGAGNTLGSHMDVFDCRALTANVQYVDAANLTNGTFYTIEEIAGQQMPAYTFGTTNQFGAFCVVCAAPPGIPTANLGTSGTITMTTGQSVGVWASGAKFPDTYVRAGHPIIINGVLEYTNDSSDATHLNLQALWTGASGTYAYTMAGRQWSLESDGPTHLDGNSTDLGGDGQGGDGSIVMDTAYNLSTTQSREICIRNTTNNNHMTDGSWYRMCYYIDPTGDLHFAVPTSLTTQQDVFLLTPAGDLTITGGVTATNHPTTLGQVTAGAITVASVTGPAVVTGFYPNISSTTVNCSTTGSVNFVPAAQGGGWKRVIAHINNCTGTASYTFPTAFGNTPGVFPQSNTGAVLAASLVTALSLTAVTITGSGTTGFIMLDGN